jgi:hypothetical protein
MPVKKLAVGEYRTDLTAVSDERIPQLPIMEYYTIFDCVIRVGSDSSLLAKHFSSIIRWPVSRKIYLPNRSI